MTFADFSKQLAKIEATPKRLEMTDLLIGLIKQAAPEEVEMAVNLSLGQLNPLYKDIDFNIAEKTVIKAIAKSTGKQESAVTAEFKINGDLGETVNKLKIQNSKFKTSVKSLKLSVIEVFDHLLAIAEDSGESSQGRKIDKTSDLLRELDPLSAKYVVRIILGNLRLGFSDRTVLDALSVMIAGDKSAREKLEATYNVRPDVAALARQIKNQKSNIKNLQAKPELGTPILPSLCQRLEGTEEIVKKMGKVAAEPKWDGQRIQAHINLKGKPQIQLFTRSLENVALMFPDLISALSRFTIYDLRFTNCILDGEVVAFDPKTNKVLPFQTMITRKRKYGIQKQLLNVPIKYMVFDVMYLNGKSLMQKPFSERREALERLLNFQKTRKTQSTGISEKSENRKIGNSGAPTFRLSDSSSSPSILSVLKIAPQLVTNKSEEIRKFLKQQIDSGLEGIVAKRLDSPYSPGRTGFSWVKLKWEGKAKSGGLVDTVDCVVMGTYAGQGKRADFGVGAFLVGIFGYQSSVIGSRLPVNQFSVNQSKTGKPVTDKPETENRKLKTDNGVFFTISKIGTGLTDEQWRELKAQSSKLKAQGCPKEYNVSKELVPDTWLKPELVVEIQADNITVSPLHTAGLALRFPRLVRYRDDKKPEQITTVEEVKKLYEMQ
ncbi:ATP-dependent DNA ligase [Candidatus Collierbacteria bacterium]|nr:ATP-dependent DNA ligase [Candidatus Collierbacteria bacterium]